MGVGVRRDTRVLSVSDLSRRIVQGLRDTVGAVWVEGELSGFKRSAPGHCWFCLKDARTQVDAVMYDREAQQLQFAPANGTHVLVFGRVDFYPARGRLQLYVEHMEPVGIGRLGIAFEQLKAKLQAEGLFDAGRKRPLPVVPRGVGIVTALRGAALQDVRRVLHERWPAVRVVVRGVRVQGPGAAAEIAAGLAEVQTIPDVDVVIVGRGGGSLEDLWAFNEEVVARAIATSRVPVVSAVGHEIDFTIADFVADVRAATPTAAAALVVPDRRALLGQVTAAARRLRDALVRRTAWDRRELDRLAARLGRFAPDAIVAAQRARLARDAERLRRTIERRVQAAQAAIAREEARLRALSPLACLERGYAIVRRDDAGAAVVRDAATLTRGEGVRLVLARGRARAHIDSTES